jgi:phosphohistidine phosphatase SixA
MTLFLVRHGDAGPRHEWRQPDDLRPLSKKGRRQAKALAGFLAERHVDRVLSSPSMRCCQTVEPLAREFGLDVERTPALLEGVSTKKALALVDSLLQHDAVLCSHGDVIPDVLRALIRRGMQVNGDRAWAKGSVWELETDGDHVASGRYHPPPH